jgi:hypothetical protein
MCERGQRIGPHLNLASSLQGAQVTVLCIRAVQAQTYIGIRESEVQAMIDEALAIAGLTERWAIVLFGGKFFFRKQTSLIYPHED